MRPTWTPRPPILCLVTDRLALARSPGSAAAPLARLRRQVEAAIDAGVDLVHLRERDLEAAELRALAAEFAARAARSATRIVVNDRLDVALAAGADGVHLRGDSFETAAARSVAPPGFLVGRSVRDARAAAVEKADYLVIGTVFPTLSKPGYDTTIGIDGLERAAAAARAPVLAIGGISEDRLAEVARTGAAGVAAIRLFFGLGEGGAVEWQNRLVRWRSVFDTNRPIS
jgi:thiamine-phosphate pyrophosphorylase